MYSTVHTPAAYFDEADHFTEYVVGHPVAGPGVKDKHQFAQSFKMIGNNAH
jgi:hypothetical protein